MSFIIWKLIKHICFNNKKAATYSTEASGQNLIFVTHPQHTRVFHTLVTASWLQPVQALQEISRNGLKSDIKYSKINSQLEGEYL